MAVPDVAAGVSGKRNDDAGYGFGMGFDGVFPAAFVRLRPRSVADVLKLLVVEEVVHVEGVAIENLETDQVQMDGMNILGGIDEAPDLS